MGLGTGEREMAKGGVGSIEGKEQRCLRDWEMFNEWQRVVELET